MSMKIIGVTVGTTTNPSKIKTGLATEEYVQQYVGEVVEQVSSGIEAIVQQQLEAYIGAVLQDSY